MDPHNTVNGAVSCQAETLSSGNIVEKLPQQIALCFRLCDFEGDATTIWGVATTWNFG